MKTLFTLVILCLNTSAFAGILGKSVFIEPFVGYKNESIKFIDLTNNATQVKAADPSYGLKFGYRSVLGIDFNLAGNIASGNAETSGQTEKNKYSHKSAAVELGINSFGLIKMFLGTNFLNEFKLEDSTALPGYTLTGPSYFAGLQFKFLSIMNLGVQYNLNQYNEITGSAYTNGKKIETYFSKIDTQDYLIYLSISI